MDVKEEIRLYGGLKKDFTRDVHNGKVNTPEAILQWLRKRLTEDQLRPDVDLGFRSAKEELAFLKRMNKTQPELLHEIQASADRSDIPQTIRLLKYLLNERSR